MTGQSVQQPHDPAKRARLIESAASVFSRVGFEAATIEDIAAGAGVAKGTVYLYFENKADLFRAVLAELQLRQETHAPDEAGRPPEQVLRDLVRSELALADDAPDLFRCFVSALFGVNRDFQQTALEAFNAQRARVSRTLARLWQRPRATRALERRASLFAGAILAAALTRTLEGKRRPRDRQDEDALIAMLSEPSA